MVKKLRKIADKQAEKATQGVMGQLQDLLSSDLAQTTKDAAQQVWYAGLGALARAQGEGMKVFEGLIREGRALQRKTQDVAESKLGDMAERVTTVTEGVTGRATAQWDKLESIFEQRTARALNSLGVPTAKDVEALASRVDALAKAVESLGGSVPRAATKRAAAKKAPAKKAAAKKAMAAPAKKAAGKRAARKVAAETTAA